MALSVPWRVTINGRDVSNRMNPYIESIECTDKAGETADTATLVFDDTDGQCVMPPKGATVEIELDGARVFSGFVDQAESIGARGSGMQLNVTCSGVDKRGKAKQRLGLHKDDGTLGDFLQAAAKEAGIGGITVDPAFAAIERPYWSTDGRSFLQLGRELAAEFGATFKVSGSRAVFSQRNTGAIPGGGVLASVFATRGYNLKSWRIQPDESRPKYAKARVRYFDRKGAKWEQEDVEVGATPGAAETVDLDGAARADKDAAKSAAGGRKTEGEREGGSGDVTIRLDVRAWAEGACLVSRVRAGIDGPYRIDSRTHKVDRAGSETRLSLKQPQGSAGTDGRAGSGQ